jgi:hypothetical protein
LATYFSDDEARLVSSSDRESSLRRIRSADLTGRTAPEAAAPRQKRDGSNGSGATGKRNKTEARHGS